MTAIAHEGRGLTALLAGLALVFGAAVALEPRVGLLLFGACALAGLLLLQLSTLTLALLFVTALVPFSVQNQFSIGGGQGSPGLLLSDALLLAALARAVPLLFRERLEGRVKVIAWCVALFAAAGAAQFLRSVLLEGRAPSTAGHEFRVVFGFSAFLVAALVVRDADGRRRVLTGLLVLGLLVGIWGLLQWGLQLGYSEAGDVGVREGVRLTTSGRGQVQGGLFAFPIAVVMAGAVLGLGQITSTRVRVALLATVALNGLCVLVTYERTFWLVTIFAGAMVAVRARGGQRVRAVLGGILIALVVLIGMATFAPEDFTAARERLLSLSQYGSDNSVRYRLVESRHVSREIAERPVVGSGFAATIFFGRPWELVRPESLSFAHNGYLWMAWKMGIPAAALLGAAFAVGLAWRSPRDAPPLLIATRIGAQASLIALLIATVTFPSVNQLPITATMAAVLAVAATSRVAAATDGPQ